VRAEVQMAIRGGVRALLRTAGSQSVGGGDTSAKSVTLTYGELWGGALSLRRAHGEAARSGSVHVDPCHQV
jgi:hypothetical protein